MNGDRPPFRGRPRQAGPPPGARPEPPQTIRRPSDPPSPLDETVPAQRVPPQHAPPPVPPSAPAPDRPPPRPTPPRRVRPKRKGAVRRWAGRIVRILLIGLLLVGLGIVGGAIWVDKELHRAEVFNDYANRPTPGLGTNWLLVGSDSRQSLSAQQQQDLATGGDIGNGRTDTILLIHVPQFGSGNPTTMVSIPRDSLVSIPDHGKDKINSAFALGGASLLIQTVELATGLRLNHYVEVGFGGFAAVVDALGGVTACPTAPINDPLAGVDLPAGCQQLGGRDALGYVRSRDTPRADLDRMANQRQFVAALLHRAGTPAVWLNPTRWYSVPRAAVDALTVDRAVHVYDLALLGWALHGRTTTMTVPIGSFTGSDVGSVVVWDHDAAGKLFDALASDGPVPASPDGPRG